ncbi:MAG: preprotein translocase subunit SecG [Burkholderiaceae bacterium]|jgi:preprotein translocase subunit SecG|nr:preprotein translocase subunit SecG [Burkholderiaceae bacterium]
MWFKIIIIVQVLSALAIIGLVLMQHGKGADMGAAFGAGVSGSLFGATGSSNFLSRSTAIAAVIFFVATLAMAYMGHRPAPKSTVVEKLETMQVTPTQAPQPEKQEKAAAAGIAAVPGAQPEKPVEKP